MIFQIKRGVVVVTSVAMAFAVVMLGNYVQNLRGSVHSLKNYNRMKEDSISYYKNQYGEVVAERDAAIVRSKDLREMENSLLRKMALQFDGVDQKLKNLASATSANSVVRQSFTTQIKDSTIIRQVTDTKYDTLVVKAIDWSDEWSRVQGIALQDCVKVDLEVDVPLNIVTYYPRWKLFGKERKWLPVIRKKMKIEAKSPNPHVTITNIEHVTTK